MALWILWVYQNEHCHRRSERSADMKTLLAIALAAAALTIGTATMAPIFNTAVAGGAAHGNHPISGAGRPVVPTESPIVRNASWAVSRNRHASRSLNRRGRLALLRLWRSAMRRRMTNWVDYDPWGYWGLGTHSPAPVYSVDWSSFGTALTSQRANHRSNVRFKMPVPPFPRPASRA